MKTKKFKSDCCKADIKWSSPSPDFFGDKSETMTIGTCCCLCSKCNLPCNIYVKVRRIWKRKPQTQVLGDKRNEIKKKITKKEIKEEI